MLLHCFIVLKSASVKGLRKLKDILYKYWIFYNLSKIYSIDI
jgi:hypothetical protein